MPGEPTARPHNAISDQPETTDPETMPEQTIPLPADVRYFTPAGPFRLECGAAIPLRIAYHTYGTFTGDNALWVCHALTANSEVADWWPHTVEAGKFLDPARWFTVCANIVGSCYGTTGPASPDPATGKPYYGAFPPVTVRDMARRTCCWRTTSASRTPGAVIAVRSAASRRSRWRSNGPVSPGS